jgi:hypothetical protein
MKNRRYNEIIKSAKIKPTSTHSGSIQVRSYASGSQNLPHTRSKILPPQKQDVMLSPKNLISLPACNHEIAQYI